MTIFDGSGNTISNTALVVVEDIIVPSMFQPIDIEYTEGDTGGLQYLDT